MMKLKYLLFLLLFPLSFFIISCNTQDDGKICPAVLCAAPAQNLRLKITDRGLNSLIFNSSKQQQADLSIYSFRLKENISFKIDSTVSTTRYISFQTAISDEFIIKVGTVLSDTLKVETKFIDQDCCGTLQITKLSFNNKVLPLTADNTIIWEKP
ncbi:hypothetical protein [Pedobacter glucosidilyticus]|uniref:hypothetical protein n=1 Tax=Pedobacter glucosidilyticus TaxID=1122941 RepID=UPI0026F119DE|nr:hypothetical protein [Pedobacter glucosidilyticus]